MLSEHAALADLYARTRDQRLALQREVDKLDVQEKKLKAELIKILKDAGATAIGGQEITVFLKEKKVATAMNWDAIHKYIVDTNSWDIMQKRLTQKAIELRWEDGVQVPGVEAFPVDELSYSRT